jgi:glycosyltransferase involved in cell wall biosynthesis
MNCPSHQKKMRVCLDIQTLVSAPTGLHRYTFNLYKNYRTQFPSDDICAISLIRQNIEPLYQNVLEQVTTSNITNKRKIVKRWLFNQPGDVVEVKPTISQTSYEMLRKQVILGKIQKIEANELAKLKIRREVMRLIMKFSLLIQDIRYGPRFQVFYDPQADVIHSPYHAFPDGFQTDETSIFRVQTVHDLIPLKFPELFPPAAVDDFKNILASARRCDLVLVPSEATKYDLMGYDDFAHHNIVVTPLAADNVFSPAKDFEIECCRKKMGIPKDMEYFLSVSTLEPRKNFPFLLKAFKDLLAKGRDRNPVLVLTGRIGWGASTQQEIAILLEELKDHVIYTGFVTDQDLKALYSGARAFLMPSIYEGFGLPLLEALACGTPVISSNTSSMPEVVGDAGILISPYDSDVWVDSMLSILELDRQQYSDLSKRSYERSLQFSWEKTARITRDSYHKLHHTNN